jgi:Protein of unknown function (DUF3105)
VRRVLGGLLIAVIALAAVVGAVLLLQSRDDAGVRKAAGPGEKVAARCPGQPASLTRDKRPLTADQLRHALELGDIVLRYRGAQPPAALRSLQDQLTGPFDAEIAAAGQAVILAPGAPSGVEALAWGRRQRARSPSDPLLREFTEAWLGEGAPKPCQH